MTAGVKTLTDQDGKTRWHVVADNNRIVAACTRGFADLGELATDIRTAHRILASTGADFYQDDSDDHEWRWRAAEGNHVAATSGEGYEHSADCRVGARIALDLLTAHVTKALDVQPAEPVEALPTVPHTPLP